MCFYFPLIFISHLSTLHCVIVEYHWYGCWVDVIVAAAVVVVDDVVVSVVVVVVVGGGGVFVSVTM